MRQLVNMQYLTIKINTFLLLSQSMSKHLLFFFITAVYFPFAMSIIILMALQRLLPAPYWSVIINTRVSKTQMEKKNPKHVIAETGRHVETFRQKLFKKSDSRWKVPIKCFVLPTRTRLLIVKKEGHQCEGLAWRTITLRELSFFFFFFPLKHNKQDHNNIKIH